MKKLQYGIYQFQSKFAVAAILAGLASAPPAGAHHSAAAAFDGHRPARSSATRVSSGQGWLERQRRW